MRYNSLIVVNVSLRLRNQATNLDDGGVSKKRCSFAFLNLPSTATC